MQGRSPTCYSPVRHSSTPKGLSVRLACVKHAASVRPEPESNSPNKNPPPPKQQGRIRIRKIRPNKKHQNWHLPKKTVTPPKREQKEGTTKNNNKQKPPNTLLSSQTTHPILGNPNTVLNRVEEVKPRPLVRSETVQTGPLASGRNTTRCSAQPQMTSARPVRARQSYVMRSISAPRPTRFSTNFG